MTASFNLFFSRTKPQQTKEQHEILLSIKVSASADRITSYAPQLTIHRSSCIIFLLLAGKSWKVNAKFVRCWWSSAKCFLVEHKQGGKVALGLSSRWNLWLPPRSQLSRHVISWIDLYLLLNFPGSCAGWIPVRDSSNLSRSPIEMTPLYLQWPSTSL